MLMLFTVEARKMWHCTETFIHSFIHTHIYTLTHPQLDGSQFQLYLPKWISLYNALAIFLKLILVSTWSIDVWWFKIIGSTFHMRHIRTNKVKRCDIDCACLCVVYVYARATYDMFELHLIGKTVQHLIKFGRDLNRKYLICILFRLFRIDFVAFAFRFGLVWFDLVWFVLL